MGAGVQWCLVAGISETPNDNILAILILDSTMFGGSDFVFQ